MSKSTNMCADWHEVDDSSLEKLLCGLSPEPTPEEEAFFLELTDTTLNSWQEDQVRVPPFSFPKQDSVLAVHWHPEFIPIPLVRERMAAMFPNVKDELCIPTQHNELLELGDYAGVEIDCFSRAFNQKVQLLAHFKAERVREAGVFKNMLSHTYNYRALQLESFLNTLCLGENLEKSCEQLQTAAQLSGADTDVCRFSAFVAIKIRSLIERHRCTIPRSTLKNKLIRDTIDNYREIFGHVFIDRVQSFVREVKAVVKSEFSPEYYYLTSEVIEEVRGLGGCIVIPHPEQFWPILLANYDVDGYEVWNPQSQRYTEFMISVVEEQNKYRPANRRKLLIFMGDDCHFSEKVRPLEVQDPAKAAREVGLQPAWDDLSICKKLIAGKTGRREVINEYKELLNQ